MFKKIAQVACALSLMLGIGACDKKADLDYVPFINSGTGRGSADIRISLENSQGESLLASAKISGWGVETGRELKFSTPAFNSWTGLQPEITAEVASPNSKAYTKELEAQNKNGQEYKSIELPSRIRLTVDGQSLEAKVTFLYSYRVSASGEIPYGLAGLRIVRIEVGERVVATDSEDGQTLLLPLVKGADGKLSVK